MANLSVCVLQFLSSPPVSNFSFCYYEPAGEVLCSGQVFGCGGLTEGSSIVKGTIPSVAPRWEILHIMPLLPSPPVGRPHRIYDTRFILEVRSQSRCLSRRSGVVGTKTCCCIAEQRANAEGRCRFCRSKTPACHATRACLPASMKGQHDISAVGG